VAYVAPCAGLASGRLHLRSEDAAHGKRDQAGYDNDEEDIHPGGNSGVNFVVTVNVDRRSVFGSLEILPGGAHIIPEAVKPVIIAEVINELLRELLLAVVGEGIVADAAVRVKVIVALAHAEREQQAVAVIPEAKAIMIEHGFGKVLNAAVCIIGIIIDDNYIHTAAVAFGKLCGSRLQLLLLIR